MIDAEKIDALRAMLADLFNTGARVGEIAEQLDYFGWELDFLREIVAAMPVRRSRA